MKREKIFSGKIFTLVFLSIILLPPMTKSQIFSEKDLEIFNSKIKFSQDNSLKEKPVSEILAEIGKSFLGTEYVPNTLEQEGEEDLVINFRGLDCTTFLETSLALARIIKKDKKAFDDYKNELTFIRYRDGKLDGYPSRLHYFSDWIHNNQRKGIVKDITEKIGGEPVKFKVGFMSENPGSYRQLKSNPALVNIIQKQEWEIKGREYSYIPENKIEKLESGIQNGDLIALTTSDNGLDIGHVGIALKMDDGRIHFLHAPMAGTKVEITKSTLSDYAKKIKKHTGIIVLRLMEP